MTDETEDAMTTEPDPGASEQLDHAAELIEEAQQAAPAALPDTSADDDLDGPDTSPGLPEDEPVTPGPN